MPKPEPLKDKKNPVVEGQSYSYLFRKKDIKLAVEWLEKKIGESNNSDTICMSKGELYEWIDEAFEDVIKNA